MLKINLLPSYIAEQKRTRTAIVLASLLWVLVLGGGLVYHFGVLMPSVVSREDEANHEKEEADRVTAYQTETDNIRQKVGPLKDKVNFVKQVRFHNELYQKIYRNAARYTYRNVEYAGMSVNGQVLSVNAYVRSLDDLGRFYLTMFGNPDVTAVSIQGIPSYDQIKQEYGGDSGSTIAQNINPAQRGWFPVQMTATLVKPVIAPQLPASAGGGGATGGGGFGGRGGAFGPPSGGGFGGSGYGPPPGPGGAGYGGPVAGGAAPGGGGAPGGKGAAAGD